MQRGTTKRPGKALAGGKLVEVAPGIELLSVLFLASGYPAGEAATHPISQGNRTIRQEGFNVLGFISYPLITRQGSEQAAQAIARFAAELQCPFVLVQWNLHLPMEFCLRLRELGLVLITADERAVDARETLNLGVLAKYDACISYYFKVDPTLQRLGVIPFRYRASLNYCGVFTPVPPESPRPVGVAYIGSAIGEAQTGARLPLLERLHTAGIDVACWGWGFNSFPDIFGGERSGAPFDPVTGRVPSLYDHYQKAKIGVDFDFFHKDRTFKILLSGALLICTDTAQMREYYTPGKEIVVFSSVDELVDLCRHYLANEPERLAIARRGYEKTLARYRPEKVFTPAHRAFVREIRAARRGDVVPRLVRALAVSYLTKAPQADDALALLRTLPQRYGSAYDYGALLREAFAALPDIFKVTAGKRAEALLIRSVEEKDFVFAQLLVPLCLGSQYFVSRLQILRASIRTLAATGNDATALRREFSRCMEQYTAAQAKWGQLGEPYADFLYIKETLRKRLRPGDTLAIFGAGGNGRAWRAWLAQHHPEVRVFFVDNDKSKHGSLLDGVEISGRERLAAGGQNFILVASSWQEAISLDLMQMGFTRSKDYLCTLFLPASLEWDSEEM